MKINKKGVAALAGIWVMALATIPLLDSDSAVFLKWWLLLLGMGIGFLPMTAGLFSCFEDKGWLFSKAIGLAVSGFFVWALTCLGAVKFHAVTCVAVTSACAVFCWIFQGIRTHHNGEKLLGKNWDLNLILWEELIFFAVFLLWTYLAGFHPEAHGTEKFMDYGFMAAMMRSETLPAADIWYALEPTNYYYGGQYYAVFLTKLSHSDVADTYNLARAMVAALLGSISFSIVYQLLSSALHSLKQKLRGLMSVCGGLLAVGSVVFAGNMHYVIYGLIGKKLGWENAVDYWFPNSTRYIGYDPETADKCIHEFPSYSFVLGDFHAHVANTMFVVAVIGLMLAWIQKEKQQAKMQPSKQWKHMLLNPYVILGACFVGLFQFTNYWDFVIYFTVLFIFIVYVNLCHRENKWTRILGTILIQTVEAFGIAMVVAWPFNASFETMVSEIAVASNHTLLYQWLVLWGLPVILILAFAVISMLGHKLSDLFGNMETSDVFVLILGLCGIGLVVIPELVYVRDIYEEGYARSNTMFKLTYQAFIMFGLVMSYILIRLLNRKEKIARGIAVFGLVLLLLTFGYFPNAVSSWFGSVTDTDQYRYLDATRYLENVFSQDASAIRWLNENVEGTPVILEASGDSYSDYERVSAMTGLPTVLGWYVHEWLWRGDVADLNARLADVQTMYTSRDAQEVQELLEKYEVSYIFVGQYEREKYADLNEALLQSLGEIVFAGEGENENFTYVIKVNPQS